MGRKKQRIKLNCKLCGNEFDVIPSRSDTAKYCSYKCSNNRIRTDDELNKISEASKQKFIDNPELRQISSENGKKAMDHINNNGLTFRIPKGYHSKEYKEKMSDLMTGRTLSDKTKNKIAKNHWSKTENANEIMDKILESRESNKSYVESRTERLITWCENNEDKTGPKSYKKGTYISTKTGNKEHYASGYELEWMRKLDDDNNVKYWTKQHGIRIEYKYKNKFHKYLPDFYIQYFDDKIEILELKGWVRNKEKLNKKIESANQYCENNSYIYNIIYQNDK